MGLFMIQGPCWAGVDEYLREMSLTGTGRARRWGIITQVIKNKLFRNMFQ